MALRGDLKSLNLGNVLQDLAYNSQTGTLRLHVGERRRFFWFEKGVLRLVGLGMGQGPSIAAGLRAIWLRRGPWGAIGMLPPDITPALVVDSLDEMVDRISEAWPVG